MIILWFVGLVFFLFIPGFFIVNTWFDELTKLEKILFSALFSIMISILIGIFFGYDRFLASKFGGFTVKNLWAGEIFVTSFFATIYLIKKIIYTKTK